LILIASFKRKLLLKLKKGAKNLHLFFF
jgi:hypothetical protein